MGGRQVPARWLAHLQAQLDTFRAYYNQRRPHRARAGRTPLVAFHARIKAHPSAPSAITHFRVRADRVDQQGGVTLRFQSRLRRIYVGREHLGARIRLFVAGAQVRIVLEHTGELFTRADPRWGASLLRHAASPQ